MSAFFGHHIRSWEGGDFRLDLFDPDRRDDGKWAVAYCFYHGEDLVFVGDDFHASPLHSLDSDETVAALLGFLSLRPGDTDAEYFESYDRRQLDFAENYGEELSLYAYELENADA